jgi:hypothetical protein
MCAASSVRGEGGRGNILLLSCECGGGVGVACVYDPCPPLLRTPRLNRW